MQASHQKWQRISIWAMLVIVGLFYGAYFFIALFACQPVEYVWERYDLTPTTSGKCNPSVAATAISYIATVMNCAADWMLAILPATVVWKAQLDRRTKISISIILGIGSMYEASISLARLPGPQSHRGADTFHSASIATLVRVPYAKYLINQSDYLYNFLPLALWSTIEVGIAITASSLATLKPLFRKFGAIFTTTNGSASWTRASRRCSSAAKAGHPGAKRQSSYHGGMLYASRKESLPSSGSGGTPPPVSYPTPARWHYVNCSDDIELVPGSPVSSSDGLYPPPGTRKPIYSKGWEDSAV